MSIYRAKALGVIGNVDQVMMTPAWETPTPFVPANLNSIITDFTAQWLLMLGFVTPFQASILVWTLMNLSTIDGTTGEENFQGEGILNVTGTSGGEFLPTFVAGVIEILIAGNPRNARMFIPGFTEDESQNGVWQPPLAGVLDVLATFWAQPFVGSATSDTYTPGLWSKKDLTFYDSTFAGNTPQLISHQVRRKPGRGS